MDKMTVSRAVAGLLQRGLLRISSGADRRTRTLVLSDEGRALYDDVAPMALAMEAEILAGFSAADRAALMGFLERLEACDKP